MSRRRRRPAQQFEPQPAGSDVRSIIRDELSKALALPAGATATSVSSGYLQALQQGSPRISGSAALPRDPYNNVPFGPGEPLFPSPISPLLPSGRPAPRQYEYEVSTNLQTTTTRSVPWTVLRDAADQVSILRSCIETCKSALTGLEWSFGIDSARARALAKRSSTSSHAVIIDLQDKFADDIERLHKWWSRPMRGWTFVEWLSAILEDELILDAVALYPRMSLGGDLLAMEVIDSSTIKPILDDRGATPIPPLAAYQQILFGFPRGDYSASPCDDVDGEYADAVYGPLSFRGARTDTLIYKVRNKRTRGPYGFSCVEQCLPDIDLWLKRQDWLRAEYSAGVTPEMIVTVDATMTPEQLRQYQAVFNDDLSGRTAERQRAQFLPAGFNPSYPQSHDAKFNSDFDLQIVRLICAAFDVLPTSIGFSPNHGAGGMGSQGHSQGEQDAQLQRGTKPRARWIIDLINEISVNYLGMPPEVTFAFHGLDDQDEQKEATLLQGRIDNALMTVNEGRDQMNLPRYPWANANEPFLATPTGPAFLNPDADPVSLPGNLPSAPQNHDGYQADSQPAAKPALPAAPRDEQVQGAPDDSPAKRAEQKAFMTFARNRSGAKWRDFEFKVLAPEVGVAANQLASDGDLEAVKALFTLADG